MKRLFIVLLSVSLAASFAGCAAKGEPAENAVVTEETVGAAEGNAAATEENADVAEEGVSAAEENVSATGGTYTLEQEGPMGTETMQFVLNDDNTCEFSLPGHKMIRDVYAGTYERVDNTVTITGLKNKDESSEYTMPGMWDFIDSATGNCVITVDDENGTFSAGESSSEAVEEDSNVVKGIAYANNSRSQQLDLYLPGQESVGTIVVVHGGGFKFGDQGMGIIKPVINAALEKGYAVASIDYRKSDEAVFPAAVADTKAAVRWVRANAEEYGLNTDEIVIWGESAGAYLSLMTALTPEVTDLDGDVTDNGEFSSAVDKLVTFYAPVEFYTMDDEALALGNEAKYGTDDSFESAFVGQNLSEDQDFTYRTYWETYKDQLPVDFSLKAFVQVGSGDTSVPYTQSENFAERLTEAIGAENVSFEIIDGAEHEDDQFYTDGNLEKVFDFIK